MGGRPGTIGETKEVIRLYNSKVPVIRIAEALGRSEQFVITRIKKYNDTKELYCPKRQSCKKGDYKQIAKLYEEGYSIKEISRAINKSYPYTYARVEKYREELYEKTWGE